jgi:hypothetical protein
MPDLVPWSVSSATAVAVQDEGGAVMSRGKLNLRGPGITATDDAANDRVNVDVGPSEAWREVGAAEQPAFGPDWANFGAPHETAAFYKDLAGRVHLKGQIKHNTGIGVVAAFTLPAGYRPAATVRFATNADGTLGSFEVRADGTVNHIQGALTLFPINASFRAV